MVVDKAVKRSVCCYYPMSDEGKCHWCGNPAEVMTYQNQPELVGELESLLCDWNSPRFLATTDLKETISKVYTFMKKRGCR